MKSFRKNFRAWIAGPEGGFVDLVSERFKYDQEDAMRHATLPRIVLGLTLVFVQAALGLLA